MKNKDIFLAIVVTFLWAFNFFVIKIGLESFPPLLFSALRFLLCAIPLVFFVRPKKMSFKTIIGVGIFLGTIKFGLLFTAMYFGMTAGLSSVVLQIQTFFTALLAYMFLKQKLNFTKVIGMLISFIGIGMLIIDRASNIDISFYSFSMIILAGLAWAISNIITNLDKNVKPFTLIVWMSLIPPIPLLTLSYFFESNQLEILQNIGLKEICVLLYTSILSTLVAFVVWSKLIKDYGASNVSAFALLVPVFGISLAYLFDERLNYKEMLSSTIIFIGLFYFVLGEKIKDKFCLFK